LKLELKTAEKANRRSSCCRVYVETKIKTTWTYNSNTTL